MRYQEPKIEVIKINIEDLITTSGEESLTNEVGDTTATNLGSTDGIDLFAE